MWDLMCKNPPQKGETRDFPYDVFLKRILIIIIIMIIIIAIIIMLYLNSAIFL